jgi:F420H(2)-dependent biliverdin reductase
VITLTDQARQFVTDYRIATLSTLAADGTLHVVPVGFTFRDGIARVIASGSSVKVRNIRERGHATLSQFDGAAWITFVGTGRVLDDPESVAEAVEMYAARYRQPRVNPERVAILIDVAKVMGSSGMK